jgi:hypothetical protein
MQNSIFSDYLFSNLELDQDLLLKDPYGYAL